MQILGSSINSNGNLSNLHAPSWSAQKECVVEAFSKAGRSPSEVDFVELHATGCALYSLVDLCAKIRAQVRRSETPLKPIWSGKLSLETIGYSLGVSRETSGKHRSNLRHRCLGPHEHCFVRHLESTAFLASLAKVCLILEHRIIPPNAHLTTRNPKILWDKHQLHVPLEPTPLGCRSDSGRSLISLASSGIGGSNGHVVVEGAPEVPLSNERLVSDTPILFPVGALTPRSAQSLSDSLISLLMNDPSPAALSQAAVYSRRARQHPWRTYFLFSPRSHQEPKVPAPAMAPSTPPPVIFVFAGQGPQHIFMGKRLFHAYRTFRQTVLEMDAIYRSFVGVSLVESTGLFCGSASKIPEGIWSAEITLPATTIVQIALYDLLISIGVKPHALIGHSAGETALIYASGAGSKAMALELAIARGRSMKLVESAENGMAALDCGLNTAIGLVEQAKRKGDGVLEIGAINSSDAVLISGSGALLNHLVDIAKVDGIFARRVQSLVPSHSSLMDSCRKQYLEGVTAVFSRHGGPHRPITRTYSTVAGQPRITTRFTPEYFWDNLRNPVHFHQGTTSVSDDFPSAVFVEISPHPALSSYLASLVGHDRVLCPMRRPKTPSDADAEALAFTRTIGDLIVLGVNQIDLTSLYGRSSRDPTYYIPYPFTERYFPMRIDGPRSRSGALRDGSTLHLQINAKTHPDLAQHVINGEPIMPGTGFLDMVSEIDSRFLRIIKVPDIRDVSPILFLRSCKWVHVQYGTWTSRPFFR